jgi:hypothetical protein
MAEKSAREAKSCIRGSLVLWLALLAAAALATAALIDLYVAAAKYLQISEAIYGIRIAGLVVWMGLCVGTCWYAAKWLGLTKGKRIEPLPIQTQFGGAHWATLDDIAQKTGLFDE